MPSSRVLAAACLACGAVLASAALEEEALSADDQCAQGDEVCALSALQLQGQRAATEEARADAEAGWPSCAKLGCASTFTKGQTCQCHPECKKFFNCCPDYTKACMVNGVPVTPAPKPCYYSANTYSLNWEASGASFFDNFTFVSQDDVHGAHQFTNKSAALQYGTITSLNGRAQLKFGGLREPSYEGEAWKRYSVNIHTNKAWSPTPGFVAALHYKRLPMGCGVWPSFWAMNSDKVWPGGGELDILEYANDEKNKVTFHIDAKCFLDEEKIEQCKPKNHTLVHCEECETSYFKNKFGCMPKQKQPDPEQIASSPGVMAAEWASDHITVFHIPEAEIPQDLIANRPSPGSWGKWVVAYLPFRNGCETLMGPQELVLNMQLCGDWSGATWPLHSCQARTAKVSGKCEAGLSRPTDCCTKWVTSAQAGRELSSQFMDIASLKVFSASGATSMNSGTFMRGGVPLMAPAVDGLNLTADPADVETQEF